MCIIIALFVLFLYPWDISNITLSEVWKALGKTVTATTLLFIFFTKYLWRLEIFKFIIPIPYLGGEWEGILKYNLHGKDYEKSISLTIKQTLFHILLTIRTDESTSHSCSASFNIDEQRGDNEIIYSYMNQPSITNREHSPIHYGAARLSIVENNTKLDGYYWTDRKTVGELMFKKQK